MVFIYQKSKKTLATGLLLLGLVHPALAQTPTFQPVTTYSAGPASSSGSGSNPNGLVVADVNRDGKPDLLTTNFNTYVAAVLLGKGDGTFQSAVTYPTGTNTATYPTGAKSNPRRLAVADVNGDGNPDLLTANSSINTAGVLLGNGNGTFQAVKTYAVGGSTPTDIAVADVNGDNKPDLLTANSNNSTASVLLGTGTGTFQTAATYATGAGSRPFGIAVTDVNGDGKLDLCTANYDDNTASVLLGNGDGTFQTATTYSVGTGNSPADIAVADVNGDGKPDLLTANFNTSTASVLLGNGTGTFQTAATYDTGGGSRPFGIAVADVNGDGKLDLSTASSNGTASVLLGNGNGTFQGATSSTIYSTGPNSGSSDIAVADVNGDNKPDLLTANPNSNTLGVLLNTTVASTPTLTSLSPASGPVGTRVTLTGTNLTGALQVSFNGNLTSTFVSNTATQLVVDVPVGATTGLVTVTTPGGTTSGITFTVALPDLVVSTGTQASPTAIPAGAYNSITITNTGYGVLAGDVSVAASFAVQSGGGLSDGCSVITGPGTFSLAQGTTLTICNAAGISNTPGTGTVQVTGSARSWSALATYVYNGTTAQATGTALPTQVRNLTIANAQGVTLSQATSVTQVLTLSTAGNLATAGNALTLLSNTSGTALLVNSSSGTVTGPVTVQRYIDPSLNSGAGYRHYSSPVSNSTVADLATASFTPVVNSSYNTSATPGLVTPFPTVFGYDQARLATTSNSLSPFDKGWVSPASLSDPLIVGQGYTVNIGASELVDFVGTATSGTVTQTLSRNTGATAADAGWQLVGNPYPSPLDYSLVPLADRPNLDAAIYVVQSSGQYSGSYRAYANGIGGNPVLPVAQGFFVRVSPGQTTGTLTFRNSQRLTAPNTTTFQRLTADVRPLVQLDLAGAGLADSFYAYAEAGATAGFEGEYDAAKLANSTGLNLSSTTAGERLAIDGREAFTTATVLDLNIGVPAAGTYTLSAATLANLPAGLSAYLHDAATGQTLKLATGTSYKFTVTANEATALLTGRFRLQFSSASALAAAPSLNPTEVILYPNPARERFTVLMPAVAGANQVQAELLNTLGQVVRRQSASLPAAGAMLSVETAGLSAGVYTLRLTAGAGILAKRVVLH